MKNLATFTVCAFLCGGLAGCAKSGAVQSTGTAPTNLAAYKTLYVQVSSQKEDLKKFVEPLREGIAGELTEKQLFESVSTDEASTATAGLTLNVDIVSYEDGNKFARTFNMGGESKLLAKANLIKSEDQTVVGELDVEGTSLHESQTQIGAYNSQMFSGFDDLAQRATQSAAHYLAEYLAEKK